MDTLKNAYGIGEVQTALQQCFFRLPLSNSTFIYCTPNKYIGCLWPLCFCGIDSAISSTASQAFPMATSALASHTEAALRVMELNRAAGA